MGICLVVVYGLDVEIGECQICLNSLDQFVCEIEMIEMQILFFIVVMLEMVVFEGEGDLFYWYWCEVYEVYYKCEGMWQLDMDVIFEIFCVIQILD